jgi:hypothetical protein
VPRYAISWKRISRIDNSKDAVHGKGECDEKKWERFFVQ